jgi:hypothetical protein
MSEFHEPWQYNDGSAMITGDDDTWVLTWMPRSIHCSRCQRDEIARRIIACVNRCEGISTEDLLSGIALPSVDSACDQPTLSVLDSVRWAYQ